MTEPTEAMTEQEHTRAMADIEALAIQMHAAELWRKLPESGKARYRLAAAAAIRTPEETGEHYDV